MSEHDATSLPSPEVIEAFTAAAITALQELTQYEAYVDPAPQSSPAPIENVVSATIRLIRSMPGKLTLVLTAEAASRLAARYLPQGTALTEEIIDDVVGEFANVIAGQAKTVLKGTLYHFTLSTPIMTRSASFARLSEVASEKLVQAVAWESGRLQLLVDLCPCPGS